MMDVGTIKTIRAETGAGVMEVKRALEESGGDVEGAKEMLRQRGAAIAEKKSDRATREGVVHAYIHGNGKMGAMIKLYCETDFVARNEAFRALANDVAMQIAAMNPASREELFQQPFIRDAQTTVAERIQETIARVGENIELGEFVRFAL